MLLSEILLALESNKDLLHAFTMSLEDTEKNTIFGLTEKTELKGYV